MDTNVATLLGPGIYYDVPERIYHADCAIEPSLSASVAETLLTLTPRRARHKHPRLNGMAASPDVSEPSAAMDEGSALHKLLLGAGAPIKLCNFDSWRSNDAKAAKRKAREAGAIPILADKYEELDRIADATRPMLEESAEDRQIFSDDYTSEVTMVWREQNGIMCRARADRMHRTDGGAPIYDFKFTDRLKSPSDYDRVINDNMWDMRAAFYMRGAATLRDGEEPPYRYVIIEKEEPFELLVIELTASHLKLGEEKAAAAIDAWGRCMAANYWPGLPRRPFYIEEPGWAKSKWRQQSLLLGHLLPKTKGEAPAEEGDMRDILKKQAEAASPMEDHDAD